MEIKNYWAATPYWMKGGVFGIVFIIIYIFAFRLIVESLSETLFQILAIPTTLPFSFAGIIGWILGLTEDDVMNIPTLILSALFLYFVIGAIIGWVVGKIKIKK